MINYESIFSDIYKNNFWGGRESKSGTGSDTENTGHIVRELPILFKEYNITSILDIPCGDFNYFKNIPLDNINYTGADIVKQLIIDNSRFKSNNINFIHLDIITSNLPKVDLILCRDCLIHFPNDKVKEALANIKKSNSKYLLTTSHNWRGVNNNKDIKFGEWRRINLETSPFNFPTPLRSIFEGSSRKLDLDRFLCLWDIESIPNY